MSLNSFYFVIFFAALFVVMTALQLLRKNEKRDVAVGRIQIVLLLLFSYFIIFRESWKFCICVFAFTCFVYYMGRICRDNKPALVIGIVVSVLMLGYFKYANFFITEFGNIVGKDMILLDIILPLGISFYTFSGISYLIDIYRGEYEAVKNPVDVALYIAFFTKITAGPIVRGKDFFPQLKSYRGIRAAEASEGIQIFVFGLFKKIVLADRLGVFVDDVFPAPMAFNTGTVILAVISYSLQIYFDFSGYSDMAIGIAKICGFDFKPNFNLPYIAKGMSDFWKRWHISLSSWFQTYLYIPLGGSRKGTVRTYFNLILVMAVSGLWHGAGLTFIVWGLLHGIGSCITRIITKSGKGDGKVIGIIRTIVTYVAVTLLWVIFRAKSFENAINVFKGMFTAHSGIAQPYSWTFFAIVCLIAGTVVAIIRSRKEEKKAVDGFYPIMPLDKVYGLTIFFVFIGLTILLGYFGDTAFIYGQF